MIILDTNVISEPMRMKSEARVAQWLNDQAAATLFVTSTSLAELYVGVEMLPPGRRKTDMAAELGELLALLFDSRILSFTAEAARAYATIVASAKVQGFNVSMPDAQIASIATIEGFAVATRDEKPFRAMGLTTINPWLA